MNKRFYISEIKLEKAHNFCFSCCPFDTPMIAGVKLENEDEISRWFYYIMIDGVPYFCSTNEDIFNLIVNNKIKEYKNIEIQNLEGVNLNTEDINVIFNQIKSTKNNEKSLVKLLLYLVESVRNETSDVADKFSNTYLDELRFNVVYKNNKNYIMIA